MYSIGAGSTRTLALTIMSSEDPYYPVMRTSPAAAGIQSCIRESMRKLDSGSGRKLLGSETVPDVKKMRSKVYNIKGTF